MAAGDVVIANPALDGARALVHPDALHDWTLRGWEPLGPAAEGADGLLTEAEWAEEQARRDSQIKAVLDGNPTRRTTSSRKG